jgi:hypothetical protein
VPYTLVQELVIRATPTVIEILHKGTRIASHLRDRRRGQVITNEEHRPKSHRAHLEQQPLLEKLTAMRLTGMVEALKTQESDPAARELTFPGAARLAGGSHWTWRENQALARRLHLAKLKGACVEDIDYRAARGLDKSVVRGLAQRPGWLSTKMCS